MVAKVRGRSIVAFLLTAGLFPPLVSWAAGPVLTLEDAVDLALRQNHRLAVAEAGVGEAEARVEETRSGRLPRLTFDGELSRTTNPTLVFSNKLNQGTFTAQDFDLQRLNDPDAFNNVNGTFSVYQPIYTGGGVRAEVDAATAERDAVVSTRERTRQQVIEEVIQAYTGAVLRHNQLEVARVSLEAAQANVALVADLNQAGLVVDSDLLQARVRETEVQELVLRSESDVEISKATLNLALGRALGATLHLPASIDAEVSNEEPLDVLVETALALRPDLKAARESIRAAGRSVESSKAGYLPDIGVAGQAQANSETVFGSYGTNWSVFVGARFKLYQGGGTRARVRQAIERESRARHEHRLLEQSIELEVRRAFHDRRSAAKRLEQASRAAEMADEGLRIVRDRYAEGLTTLVELLDSETRLTRARTRAIAARRDVLLTDARLDLAVGRL